MSQAGRNVGDYWSTGPRKAESASLSASLISPNTCPALHLPKSAPFFHSVFLEAPRVKHNPFDMAEALTTVAAIVGLVDVAAVISSQVLHLAREWKNATAQIQSLCEEIEMSHHISKELKALWELLEGQSQPPGYAEAISTQIKRARPVWTELENIVQSVQGPLKPKVRRDKWMVKAYRVAALQGQLREIRTSTRDILNIHTALVSLWVLVENCNLTTRIGLAVCTSSL